MSDINVDPGTVAIRNTGGVAILNVGEGDTKLSFDPENPAERIRAARIVKDMLRRGYALMVEIEPGSKKYRRVHKFDEARCEYIIADLDTDTARAADEAERRATDELPQSPAETPAGAPAPKRGRPKLKERRLDAGKTRAVSVGRTAGG